MCSYTFARVTMDCCYIFDNFQYASVMATKVTQEDKRRQWRLYQRDWRARKAAAARAPQVAFTPEFEARAREEAERRVRAAVMPENFPSRMARDLQEAGVPFDCMDLFSLWYEAFNDPCRPNHDIWRMSDSARDFTSEVWAAKTVLEHQGRKAGATAIANKLKDRFPHYTDGSRRVMVDRALRRISRIEAAI